MIKRAVLFLVCALIFQNLLAQTSNSQNSTIAGSSDPILLIAPFDKDTIDELNPIFNWSTSTATTLQVGDAAPSQISYKYLLVKINTGQTKESAIQENQPIYYIFPAQGNMLQYPVSATELQRGNRYAWKIEKYLNGALLNQSEVWEFYIRNTPKPHKYIQLKPNLDASICSYSSTSNLYFIFEENYSNQVLKGILVSENQTKTELNITKVEESASANSPNSIISYGNNKYMVDLSKLEISVGIYILKVTAVDGTEYYQRIQIEK